MYVLGVVLTVVFILAALAAAAAIVREYWARPKGLQHAPVPCWQFWRPGSGLIGGLIFGFLMAMIVMLTVVFHG